MPPSSAIVIGAGVSGLTAAVALRRRGAKVALLEAGPRVGGAAHAARLDGFLCEEGPNTLLISRPETRRFLEETGLLDAAIEAAPQAQRRFVVREGRLVALPSSPMTFLASPILSWRAKARLLREPFLPRGTDPDETLAQFVRRRLGDEMLREFVDPFVSGVYAGDAARLILRHAMPRLHRLEQAHGSLIRGAIRVRGGTEPKGRLVSWKGGLGEMAERLAAMLGEDLRTNTPVDWIRKTSAGFEVGAAGGTLAAEGLILATDGETVVRLLSPHAPEIRTLATIPYSPIIVLHLGFRRAEVIHPLDGFGALISRARGIRTLGTLFSSTLFPGRAPDGSVLLTAFIGGRHDPHALDLDDGALLRTVLGDLGPLLGLQSAPVFQRITRWPRAIPQYERGHERVIEACVAAERALAGLHLLGNFRGGISMNDCMANAAALAGTLSEVE